MHDHKQRHRHGGHGSHGPAHGPGHHGPAHHDHGGSCGRGRHGHQRTYEGTEIRQAGAREQTSPAGHSAVGEGCPKRGGTADCPGDCRTCPNQES